MRMEFSQGHAAIWSLIARNNEIRFIARNLYKDNRRSEINQIGE